MVLWKVKLKFFSGWILIALCLAVLDASAQSSVEEQNSQPVAVPESPQPATNTAAPPAKPVVPSHKFWDKENDWLFAGVAVSRALDYSSTRNFLARGRSEILIPDDVVNSEAGFPALEAAGAMTSVGISYIFHHYHHHKMERWVSIVHIGVTSFGAARNYALKSKHP